MKAHTLLLTAGTMMFVAPAALAETSGTDEVRSIVAEMMADAQTRSSLLQSGGNAGYDGGFFISDASGDYTLKIKGVAQFRYTAHFNDDNGAGSDDYEGGFSTPRTKLNFSGNAHSQKLVYNIQGEFSGPANAGSFTLEDAYVGYNFDNGWGLYWGQVRLPVLWEDVISETGGLAADVSVTNGVFNPGRSKALWAFYSNESYRNWIAFSDGAFSANTDFEDDGNLIDADYAFTYRGEFLLAGDWGQFFTMSSAPGSEFGAKLGLGFHYQDGPDRPGDVEVEVVPYTADLMLQGDGWNFYTAFIGRSIEIDGGAGGDFDDYGFIAQGGIFIPETDWEFFARYDVVFPDEDYAGDDDFSTVTFGLNWYWQGQAAKFTIDAQIFLDDTVGSSPVDAFATGTGSGIGLISTTEDSAVAIRAQFQLLF